jgi:hypothetical protein
MIVRHCGLDPQSLNPKNYQEIAGQARNDETRQFQTKLQAAMSITVKPAITKRDNLNRRSAIAKSTHMKNGCEMQCDILTPKESSVYSNFFHS